MLADLKLKKDKRRKNKIKNKRKSISKLIKYPSNKWCSLDCKNNEQLKNEYKWIVTKCSKYQSKNEWSSKFKYEYKSEWTI